MRQKYFFGEIPTTNANLLVTKDHFLVRFSNTVRGAFAITMYNRVTDSINDYRILRCTATDAFYFSNWNTKPASFRSLNVAVQYLLTEKRKALRSFRMEPQPGHPFSWTDLVTILTQQKA